MDIPIRKILRQHYPEEFSGKNRKKMDPQLMRARIKRLVIWLVVLLVLTKVVLLLFYYNRFLSLQYDVEESRAQIDAQLQYRKNIIVNMALIVRDYAGHEKAIFSEVTEAHRRMTGPGDSAEPADVPKDESAAKSSSPGKTVGDLASLMGKKDLTAADMQSLLSRVFAVAEAYPNLRLSESYQKFQDALVEAEHNIAEQRMLYNQRANIMSTELGVFPGLIFAKIYKFESPPFFIPEEEATKFSTIDLQ